MNVVGTMGSCRVRDDEGRLVMIDTGAEVPGVCSVEFYNQQEAGGNMDGEIWRRDMVVKSAALKGPSLGYQHSARIPLQFGGKARTSEFFVCANYGGVPLVGNPTLVGRGESLLFDREQWVMKSDEGELVRVPMERLKSK